MTISLQRTWIFAVVFVAGSTLGIGVARLTADSAPTNSREATEVRQSGYQFINPLLECEQNSGYEETDLRPFKAVVQRYVDDRLASGSVQTIAVYYRDLNNGPWFGINQDIPFAPASLLKVPTMLAYYMRAETDPEILARVISPDEAPGETVDDLISDMIIDSSNRAFTLLDQDGILDTIAELHATLGIPLPGDETPDDYLTVREYASIFRILYNSSLLSRTYSERALELLSRVTYRDGLVAGVADDVTVTHKYGVVNGDPTQKHQLHDCGIVYYPDHPYLLCVMTRGDDPAQLTDTIATVSRTVYTEIVNRYE